MDSDWINRQVVDAHAQAKMAINEAPKHVAHGQGYAAGICREPLVVPADLTSSDLRLAWIKGYEEATGIRVTESTLY
jgi:hypothetical protein